MKYIINLIWSTLVFIMLIITLIIYYCFRFKPSIDYDYLQTVVKNKNTSREDFILLQELTMESRVRLKFWDVIKLIKITLLHTFISDNGVILVDNESDGKDMGIVTIAFNLMD